MGALLAVRLARKIRDSFTFKFKATRYFTDSSAILGMLKCDSDQLPGICGNQGE
jgi:hypothetical protein